MAFNKFPIKHTPLPWYNDEDDIYSNYHGNIVYVGSIYDDRKYRSHRQIAQDNANAEFIVRAVNSHDDLLKTLRSIELSVDAVNSGGDPLKALAQIKEKARATIQNAEGK